MTQYTLVAYRENGNDYCRGCHMGSSDSDFGMEFTEDLTHLQNMYAEYLKMDVDAEDDRAVQLWELTILVDGKDLYFEDGTLLESITDGAKNIAKLYKEGKALKAAADALLKQQQAAERKRQHDLAELARLQCQYGGVQ
jgi:hypothetical protein